MVAISIPIKFSYTLLVANYLFTKWIIHYIMLSLFFLLWFLHLNWTLTEIEIGIRISPKRETLLKIVSVVGWSEPLAKGKCDATYTWHSVASQSNSHMWLMVMKHMCFGGGSPSGCRTCYRSSNHCKDLVADWLLLSTVECLQKESENLRILNS